MESLPKTLEILREKFGPVKDVNKLHREQMSGLDKLALFITEKIGTMGFFFIIFGWTVLWLGWNMLAPANLRFDPYPAFVLWLFISNLIQIHLMPLIMIGQNIQGQHTEIRSENDFKTNQKAEKEVELIIEQLEKQDKLLQEILEKLEKVKK
jgi:uncharacterized membrane protein